MEQHFTRSLHVGNLEAKTTKRELFNFFSDISEICPASLHIVRDKKTRAASYAYVNFLTSEDAEKALQALNLKDLKGHELVISRATPADQRNPAANVYVSQLPENTRSEFLYNAFSVYGDIVSCHVALGAGSSDRLTYGYVRFATPEAAQAAIEASKNPITINGVAATLPVAPFIPASQRPSNCTNVFVCNFPANLTNDEFNALVSKFGTVTSIYKPEAFAPFQNTESETGFGFANYATNEQALAAIEGLSCEIVDGHQISASIAKSKQARRMEIAKRTKQYFRTHSKKSI